MQKYAKYISETEVQYPTAEEFIGVVNWQSHDFALRSKGYVPLIGDHKTPEGYVSRPVKFQFSRRANERIESRPFEVDDYEEDLETHERKKTGSHTEWRDTAIEVDESFISVLEWEDTEIIPSLDDAVSKKLSELDAWDNAELPDLGVNWFTVNHQERSLALWIKKADRSALALTINAAIAEGKESITVWAAEHAIQIPLNKGMSMLYTIEAYASECYCVTAAHRKAICEMTDAKKVAAYDFKTGYPEHPEFNF